jgi:hypothetical protein
MTMKKEVNGKSFDEIFAQRGKRVSFGELKEGKVYLFDQKGRFDWDWIGRVAKRGPLYGIDILLEGLRIASDGDEGCGAGLDSIYVRAIHEATPDQIDLLNAYK